MRWERWLWNEIWYLFWGRRWLWLWGDYEMATRTSFEVEIKASYCQSLDFQECMNKHCKHVSSEVQEIWLCTRLRLRNRLITPSNLRCLTLWSPWMHQQIKIPPPSQNGKYSRIRYWYLSELRRRSTIAENKTDLRTRREHRHNAFTEFKWSSHFTRTSFEYTNWS